MIVAERSEGDLTESGWIRCWASLHYQGVIVMLVCMKRCCPQGFRIFFDYVAVWLLRSVQLSSLLSTVGITLRRDKYSYPRSQIRKPLLIKKNSSFINLAESCLY